MKRRAEQFYIRYLLKLCVVILQSLEPPSNKSSYLEVLEKNLSEILSDDFLLFNILISN